MKFLKNILSILNREMPICCLKKRGLKIGKNFSKQQGCFIDPSHCFLIEIGDNVTFSNRVTLLAHDASSKKISSYVKIGKIKIEDNVFIGANVTVLPNVKIGKNAIIGASSVVTKDVPENSVVVGNPAKVIMDIEEYENKIKTQMDNSIKFEEDYKIENKVSKEKKEKMKDAVERYGICFIK